MKSKDLRDLSVAELNNKVSELKQESMNLRFQHATKQLENTAGIDKVRRDIARALTILTEKERQS